MMKKQILTTVLAMTTVVAFAQKREIRRAGNAVEDGEYQEAKNYLMEAEPELSEVDEDRKADFYLYKGQAYLGTGENVSPEDLMIAAEAFQQAEELGSEDAAAGIRGVSNALVNAAIADQNAQNFAAASEKLYTSYQLNESDTLYLYYAASNAVNSKDYDKALEYYEELRDLGFTGITKEYTAVNKATGEVETMASEEQRDLFMKSGDYTDPQVKVTESRKGEIAKNIALIYIDRGETEKAIAAMEEAKKENPNDTALLQAEADMYYEMGNMEKYGEIMEQIVEKNPNDPVLFYNLGVSTAELGNNEKAIEYYKKALELDPEMSNARINIAYVILSKEQPIIEQMNQLGTSEADNKKYEQLSEERNQLYKDAMPHLIKVLEVDQENVQAAKTLMNIYYQLGQSEKAEEMQQRIADIEAGQ